MTSGWRYRVAAVGGVVALIVGAVTVANYLATETLFGALPIVGHLPLDQSQGWEFLVEAGLTSGVVLAALVPLYKPQPRRILDTWLLASKRTVVALFALATIGYFDYTYRLPRATLIIVGILAVAMIPLWFVAIRSRPTNGEPGRTVIVGDDPEEIDRVLAAVEGPVLGYLSPPTPYTVDEPTQKVAATDGSGFTPSASELACLGGLSRLEDVFIKYDVDTAVFAFAQTDREEFFGALATCHEFGVDAKIHREKADTVLTEDDPGTEVIKIAVEPWDPQDRALKRIFDIGFSVVGLLVTLPLSVVIAVAIKLDSSGPVLYSQQRTAEFGGTFDVYKFRSMVQNAEAQSGVKLSEEDHGNRDPRVTRVGHILRRTHLDEIPQLWSILIGDMSVVGPRPERPELDREINEGVTAWRRRWFVRPGLTGLAQINNVTGHEPAQKLRYDIEYIRDQSIWFDTKIVLQQIWKVFGDVVSMVFREET